MKGSERNVGWYFDFLVEFLTRTISSGSNAEACLYLEEFIVSWRSTFLLLSNLLDSSTSLSDADFLGKPCFMPSQNNAVAGGIPVEGWGVCR